MEEMQMRVPQRGRAILRRLSASDAGRAFRPGDFLLTSSDAGLARIQGWATGGPLNHAALIVDAHGTVIEANPSFLTDARAYRYSSIANYLEAGKTCWVGYVELREGTRGDVVAYAEHIIGSHGIVSLGGRLLLAFHTLLAVAPRARTARHTWLNGLRGIFDRHALVVREEHCCSSGEFVARALERGGFIWDRDPAHVTPDDLFQRYYNPEFTSTPPASITPIRFTRARTTAPSHERTDRGAITPFAPRAVRMRGSTQGATALREEPSHRESPQAGMHALLQLGVMTAAGLAAITVFEELIQLIDGNG